LDAEVGCDTIHAFNVSDGRYHAAQFVGAFQERRRSESGEFPVARVDILSVHLVRHQHPVIDAAIGVIERGSYVVADSTSTVAS
jgi:hypothetical protein